MSQPKNPFTWLEIYVEDMNRAQQFYETVLEVKLVELPMPTEEMGEMQMLSFPSDQEGPNISGALVKMPNMAPGAGGTLAYFACEDCSLEESRVESAGGQVIQPKMSLGEHGFCSLAMDTEGNMIGLHSMK